MTNLHEALSYFKPTTWDSVPQSPEELREYVRDIFKNGRLAGESLPDPPPYDASIQPTTCVVPSSARVGESDPEITSLQEQWGKPIKVGGPRENPLGLHVWKLSASDGGGSWFGRRSVHEGMPFTRWKEKISSEYDETLKVNSKKLERGEVPDKAIRGIGAEKKVETLEVKNEDGSPMAQVTVYHVSAQFPKPTAPRDFVAMIIASENALEIGGSKVPGRSWMMISKPCEHPDVQPKQGYTRGEYESVEIIREIPRGSDSSGSSTDSLGKDNSPDAASKSPKTSNQEGNTEETTPVEWIMVSRSDPGGSIPRWMVDKGTPRSVGMDAAKFINWAVQDEKLQEEEEENIEDVKVNEGTASKSRESFDGPNRDEDKSDDSDSEFMDSDDQSHHGLIASVTGLINAGIGRFAPQGFTDYNTHQSEPNLHHQVEESDTELDEVKTPSTTSKATRPGHSRNITDVSFTSAHSETAAPIVDEVVKNVTKNESSNGKPSNHEKDLNKLAIRKKEVETRMEAIRAELEQLQGTSESGQGTPLKGLKDEDSEKSAQLKRDTRSSTPASSSGTQTSQRGDSNSEGQASQSQSLSPETSAKNQKTITQLVAEQAKLVKRLRKIEADQLKIATKIEARHRKDAERSERSKSKSEVEGLRQEIKDLKKEVSKLRSERQNWVDIVAALQAENTALHAKNTKLSGGDEPADE